MAKPTKETARHKAAFDFYLSLGADRSLEAVGKKFGVSSVSAENWSVAFGWAKRIEEREDKISAMASAKVDTQLADHQAKLINIGQAVIGLFVKRIKSAVDEEGNLKPRGWKPSALDAKVWSEVVSDILSKSGSSAGSGINQAALEGESVEQVERILIERVTRIARARNLGLEGGGKSGV